MRRRSEIGRPKGSSSMVTRARILLSARAAFSQSGYSGTSVEEIAERAGVSDSAIFKYFHTKVELYMATVREANQALLPAYRRVVAAATSTREALRGLLLESAELHHRDPSLAVFLSALPVEMQRHPDLAAAMADSPSEVVELFEKAVEIGVKTGEVRRAQAPLIVALFVATSMGLSQFAAAVVGSNLHDIVETFLELIDGNLFKRAKK